MDGRAIMVHSLAHAKAALAAASDLEVPVVLVSAPGAAAYLGAGFFDSMIAQAREAYPEARARAILDCGDAPGLALAALRQGIAEIRFAGKREVAAKIAAIARRSGARLHDRMPPALDLLDVADPAAACRNWLAGM